MKRLAVAVGAILLMGVLSAPSLFAQNNDQQMDQNANQIAQQQAGREPHMAAALEHLRQAADELEKATHDKGGHRVQALQLTHQAMTHVEEGIKYSESPQNNRKKK